MAAEPPSAIMPVTTPDQNQELVLQLHLGRYILSDGFIAYAAQGGVLLPLSEIAYTLEFPIEVIPSEGRADGWFLQQNRRFSLNYDRAEVIAAGRHFNRYGSESITSILLRRPE